MSTTEEALKNELSDRVAAAALGATPGVSLADLAAALTGRDPSSGLASKCDLLVAAVYAEAPHDEARHAVFWRLRGAGMTTQEASSFADTVIRSIQAAQACFRTASERRVSS